MTLHQPVLLAEVMAALGPQAGESYLDLTGGYGGHAAAVLAATQSYKTAVLVDRDETAVHALEERFGEKGATIIHDSFCEAAQLLVEHGQQFDLILGDFGVSSVQLDRPERGFSFRADGALDMRMDARQRLSAETVVNRWRERELAETFARYGEVSLGLATKVAKAIVHARPVGGTEQLATVIARAVGGGYHHRHPATRFFQALRIVVNDELGEIERTLPLLEKLLKSGGRVALISFHSLEDRLVKQYFKADAAKGLEAKYQSWSKTPITATSHEQVINPRARSAKLRVAVRQ
jgi:16S rRNA (cytosine1402-N4)-methyltransferase